jgi:hypothetical protein
VYVVVRVGELAFQSYSAVDKRSIQTELRALCSYYIRRAGPARFRARCGVGWKLEFEAFGELAKAGLAGAQRGA